ncbi:MAG TPA: hypothetical protein V6C46_05550 [Coleofasciculaceae cyanobacterium]
MQTIETNVHIGDDHKLMIDLPDSVSTGKYQVVLVLQPQSAGSDPAVEVEDNSPVNEIAERWKK